MNDEFLKDFETNKFNLLDHSLYINQQIQNGVEDVPIENYVVALDWIIKFLWMIEDQIEYLSNKNKMKNERIDQLLIKLGELKLNN